MNKSHPISSQSRPPIVAYPMLLLTLLALLPLAVLSQSKDTLPSPQALKRLSLEELMNIEVTSISMRPEKLTEVASAVQVITAENIHRSGVMRLPEALRLASNLQISQANSHDWAVTARGFNGLPSAGGIVANKLQVTIDGRSVYSPIFGGVFWDLQNTLLKDVDRIEVVSGPGGTLWGANAVNGVINIVSKSAKETQGLYVSGAAGSFLQDQIEARYGFQVDSNVFVRVYGQRIDQRDTKLDTGGNAFDAWSMTQSGFRMDYYQSKANTFTFQGDFYWGEANESLEHLVRDGQNVLARFTHIFSDKSNLTIQAYFDRTWRNTPKALNPLSYELNTYDLDVQHRFPIGKHQSILWGAGYRLQQDEVSHSLTPLSRDMPLYSGFIQDEITLLPDLLKLTIGSKFLHNVFSGFNIQPTARLAWIPNIKHTIWTSVSGAVRTPSRYDVDVAITPLKFHSEKITAYELGYRVRPSDRVSLSFATFFNRYNDLRSFDANIDPVPPIIVANSQLAKSWGLELFGSFQATEWWHLRGGYTFFKKEVWANSDRTLPVSVHLEGVDP
ncbi:MAG TPA: TonB-dependent receptor plug domain-containing protein, partial [Flavitalea sp.]|nr:TonB-dependent receptor plug domain-containing protein [Flavitalea sp.]